MVIVFCYGSGFGVSVGLRMAVILLLGCRVVFGDLDLVFIVVLCTVVGVVSGVVSGGVYFFLLGWVLYVWIQV